MEAFFETAPLKEGVDRDQAFRLITLVREHFENQYWADLEKNNTLDEAYLRDFLEERNRFLSMIRFGILKKGGDVEDGKKGHTL
jgi:TetR/AcrR family transcriptional regulator